MIDFPLDLDERIRDDVTLVLVAESEQSDVRLDGPNQAQLIDTFRIVSKK